VREFFWGVVLGFLGLFFLFFSNSVLAYYEGDFTKYEVGSSITNPLTIADLNSAIAGLKNPSIEALLPVLKKRDPNIFHDYVMLYGSRSLQESSATNPRVLLITKKAEMILSFNGDEKQKGFNELEVMFFDKNENRFNFQEFSFQNGKVKASEVNPRKCLACHQSPFRKDVDPRPNWEAYNLWPGVFGSVGHISDVTDQIYEKGVLVKQPRYNEFLATQRKQEESITDIFFTSYQPQHPRYSQLVPFQKFQDNKTSHYYSGVGADYLPAPNRTPLFLTQSLAVLNARRLARLIQTDYPEIQEAYKYALMSAVKCFELPLPPDLMEWHKKKLSAQNISWDPSIMNKNVGKLEYAMDFIFKAYGIDTADWTTDFNTNGQFAMTEKYGIPSGSSVSNPAYAESFQEIWNLPEFDADDDCSALKKKSLEVLSQKISPTLHPPELTEIVDAQKKPLLDRCISCHVLSDVAPFIPFDDPGALKVALKKNDGRLYQKILYRLGPMPNFRDAMPPQGYVYPGQKQDVLNFISGLYLEN
jgi:hypothetical protein